MAYYYQHNVMWYVDPDVMVLRSPLTMDQARVWATLQGLTGQALMATDRMMDLGEERVEMLKRVYPAVDIRPLDLYPSERNKRIWDLKVRHLGRQYDVVGVFNFDEKEAQTVHLRWSDLGLPTDRPLHVFDFWNKDYLGAWQAGMTLDVVPTSCRVLTVLPSNGRIQLISTNRHITQGWVDLKGLGYDETTQTYTGTSRVIRNDPYELRFVFPRGKNYKVKAVTARSGRGGSLPVSTSNHQGWACVRVESATTTEVDWKVSFEPEVIYAYPAGNPERLRVERVGLDGVDVTWAEQYYLNCGYQVYLDGRLQGYTPKATFPLRGLDPKADHTVAVETVWEDGTVSAKKAERTFSVASMLPKQMPLSQLKAIPSGESRRGPWQGTQTGPVSIGEKSYPDALVLRPGSESVYEIKGLYKTFSASIGIGDQSNDETAVEFVVLGDGKELFKGGPLKKADGLKSASVEIPGIQRLVLRVTGTADRRTRIQAAWVDGTLSQ